MSTQTINKPVSFLVSIIAVFAAPGSWAASDECKDNGDYAYVCGIASAEDLVLIPETNWIIASGFSDGPSLYVIDAENKSWSAIYPAESPRAEQDMETFGACPGSPDPNAFVAHGLSIEPGMDGHSTLYVVGHGEREAIEIFDVDANGDTPEVTWRGCVLTPDGMEANSVAASDDGSMLITIPLHTGITINQAIAGEDSGAAYAWSPGDDGFTKIAGTEMPYANGIEVSDDGKEFYIASSGLQQVLAFSNSNPATLLRRTETFSVVPDNIHMGSNGKLLTAGMSIVDPVCGDVSLSLEFDLGKLASCPRPFSVLAVDRQSMQVTELVNSPAHERFSNITMALEVGNDIWMGTFAGDRVAYRSLD